MTLRPLVMRLITAAMTTTKAICNNVITVLINGLQLRAAAAKTS